MYPIYHVELMEQFILLVWIMMEDNLNTQMQNLDLNTVSDTVTLNVPMM